MEPSENITLNHVVDERIHEFEIVFTDYVSCNILFETTTQKTVKRGYLIFSWIGSSSGGDASDE